MGFKKVILPQIQWYSTTEVLRVALALSWQSVPFDMGNGWLVSHSRECRTLASFMWGSWGSYLTDSKEGVVGGRHSRQAQKSLLAILYNSASFQTTQRNCLPLLGHRACMFTHCLDTILVFFQKNTSCRKETVISSSQILKTKTKKPL